MTDILRRRIRERLSALNLTPRAASLKAGLGPDLIRDLLRRPENRLLSDSLHNIAVALDTTSSYLLGETREVRRGAVPVRRRDEKLVPLQRLAIVPEFGGLAQLVTETDAPLLYWRSEWVERYLGGREENGRYLELTGDSYVDGLGEGDVLCLDISRIDPARDPGIYGLYDGHAVVVRRVQLVAGCLSTIRILSDNARYPSYDMEGRSVQILGRIVWRAGGM